MYNAVDQSVLLYRIEIWVVTEEMLKVLERFHHRSARHITGVTATHGVAKEWEYPLVVAALKAAIIHPIREYIRRRQDTIA